MRAMRVCRRSAVSVLSSTTENTVGMSARDAL